MSQYRLVAADGPSAATEGLADDLWAAIQELGHLAMRDSQTMVCIREIQGLLQEVNLGSAVQMQDCLNNIQTAVNIAVSLHNRALGPRV